MATYHLGSFDAATVDGLSPTGLVRSLQANAYNSNKCAAYDDNNFSSWGANANKVQKIFVPGAGLYAAAMANESSGNAIYCGFSSLSDLLNNAQFIPLQGGGGPSLGGGVYSDADAVAVALSNAGGLLILPTGDVTAGP